MVVSFNALKKNIKWNAKKIPAIKILYNALLFIFFTLKKGYISHNINPPMVIRQNAIVSGRTSGSNFTKIAEELTLNNAKIRSKVIKLEYFFILYYLIKVEDYCVTYNVSVATIPPK